MAVVAHAAQVEGGKHGGKTAGRGRLKNSLSAKLPKANPINTRKESAKAAGVGERTYDAGKLILDAAPLARGELALRLEPILKAKVAEKERIRKTTLLKSGKLKKPVHVDKEGGTMRRTSGRGIRGSVAYQTSTANRRPARCRACGCPVPCSDHPTGRKPRKAGSPSINPVAEPIFPEGNGTARSQPSSRTRLPVSVSSGSIPAAFTTPCWPR